MEGTPQNKTLEDVCGMLNTLTKSQAELTCTVSELVKALKDNTAAVKQLTKTLVKKDGRATRSAEVTTKDAGTRLTNTYELLEQILLDTDLPMETVFFAQRVNKQFRSLIGRSKDCNRSSSSSPSTVPTISDLSNTFHWAGRFASPNTLSELTDRNGVDLHRLGVVEPGVFDKTLFPPHQKYVAV
ncbi:hypothetical protein LTR49_026857 [Elasticomyces elasticus]|nr:hypothetical protein LTR49_026857 [Elasticomyces elasticus]